MLHDLPLISTITVGLALALGLGFVATRLKLPALLGYLLAGIVIGPHTPGFVADLTLAKELAEIGVMLLMFGVGLHFSLDDLWAVRRIAIPGAIVQMLSATLLGMGISHFWGFSWTEGVIFGLALSVASTVVLLRALESRGLLYSSNGQIAVGWLIVEDLAMVLILVLLPPLALWLNSSNSGQDFDIVNLLLTFSFTLAKIFAFLLLMFVAGARLLPWLLWQVARSGSSELFNLAVIVAALGVAYAAASIFGVSFALGAFVAGMMLRKSALSQRAAEESLPLRDAFAVLFFVAVGMLFNPMILLEKPLEVLTVLAIIVLGKSLVAFLWVLLFRYPLNTALTVSVSLAQIGEFSFILIGLGIALGLLPQEGQQLILAGALLSIALNPLLFYLIEPLQSWLRRHSKAARAMEDNPDPLAMLPETITPHVLTEHIVVIGYGRVGKRITDTLLAKGFPVVVAEQNRELVQALREKAIPAVFGSAVQAEVLVQAHVARAAILVIALPDACKARQIIDIARILKPNIKIIVRVHHDEEENFINTLKVTAVFMGERTLAQAMSEAILLEIKNNLDQHRK